MNDQGLVDKLNELGHLFRELNERTRHLVLEQTERTCTTWRLLKHYSGLCVLWSVEPQVAMPVWFELGRPKLILFLGDWHSRETRLTSCEEGSHWPMTPSSLLTRFKLLLKFSQYSLLKTQGDVAFNYPNETEIWNLQDFFQPRIACLGWKWMERVQFGW